MTVLAMSANDINQVLAGNLRTAMTLKGLTQTSLASKTGMGQTTVSLYLRPADRKPGKSGKVPSGKISELEALAAALDCAPADLLASKDQAKPAGPIQSFGAALVELGRRVQALAPTRRKLIAVHAAEVLEHGPKEESAGTLDDLARGVQAGGLLPPEQVSPELAEFITIAKLYADELLQKGSEMTPATFILRLQEHRQDLVQAYREQQAAMDGSTAKVTS